MSASWATLMNAVRYGYSPYYFLRIEGNPTIHCETIRDAIAPAGYSFDASLVIDKSAKIGSVLDEKTHISKGFDLEARFLDTPTVRAQFRRPTLYTTLSADLTATTTTIPVTDTIGWAAATKLYFGTSCASVSAVGYQSFTSGARNAFGRQRSYKSGTVVTNAPYVWLGRKVDLFLVLLDPRGYFVQGADILANACCVWSGYVTKRPRKDGTEWVVSCRDQVRRLADPLGVAASGQATWELDDDAAVPIDPEGTVINCQIDMDSLGNLTGGSGQTAVQVRPLSGQTSPLRRSRIRELVASSLATAFAAASGAARLGTPVWTLAQMPANASFAINRYWRMMVPVSTTATTQTWVDVRMTVTGAQGAGALLFAEFGPKRTGFNGAIASKNVDTPLVMFGAVSGASLSVTLDGRIAFADLPTSGWVGLEGSGGTQYKKYTSITQDAANSQKAILGLDWTTATTGTDLQGLARDSMAGQLASVGVKFYWRDSGSWPDVLRRAIVSTGDAQNGSYDSLPKGQGLGLDNIDSASFDTQFDGAFIDMTTQIAVEAGQTLESLTSGILRLSQRALCTRRAADGSAVNIAACAVGSADGPPVTTITDDMLVSAQGRRPVRVIAIYTAPQAIDITCRVIPAADQAAGESALNLRDKHLTDWTNERWALDIYGVSRAGLLDAAIGWGESWFRSGENRQTIEIDVPPWVDVQVGDVIKLSLTDPNLWDYAAGSPGLTTLARVIGAQISLVTGVQTLTISTDGVMSSGPMSPSLPIVAVNGAGATPTSIDISSGYLNLVTYAANGLASWKVLAYLPGQDKGRAEYVLGAITSPGGGITRLAVTTYPSSPAVTLTTNHRLTWPILANCTATQTPFLHNTQRVQWS